MSLSEAIAMRSFLPFCNACCSFRKVLTLLLSITLILSSANCEFSTQAQDFSHDLAGAVVSIETSSAEDDNRFLDRSRTFGLSQSEFEQLDPALKVVSQVTASRHSSHTHYATDGDQYIANEVRYSSADDDDDDANPEENNKFFEGDIVLWPFQAKALVDQTLHGTNRRRKRKFIRSGRLKWDSSKSINYAFHSSQSERSRKAIRTAIKYWEDNTCLKFRERNYRRLRPNENVIVFTKTDGCASNVGKAPFGGPQFVSLARECLKTGVMAHEIAHALGFWHEQSRPDRDRYVTVLWKNIKKGLEGQFTKELNKAVYDGQIGYDYGSIMHYRGWAYGKTRFIPTLQTNIPGFQQTIGQRAALSFNDVKLMNSMYCSHKCSKRSSCEFGGYPDPKDCSRCRCPDGLTGKTCKRIAIGKPHRCGGVIRISERAKYISTPYYPAKALVGQECTWRLQAKKGRRIQLVFVGKFSMICKHHGDVCLDYVEVINGTMQGNSGMRYCCPSPPRQPIYSLTNTMLVLWRAPTKSGRFKALVRSVEPDNDWTSWSSWSECSANCGGCGSQVRYRRCPNGACKGNRRVQTQSCNSGPCKLCFRKSKCITMCCENYWIRKGECLHGGVEKHVRT